MKEKQAVLNARIHNAPLHHFNISFKTFKQIQLIVSPSRDCLFLLRCRV